MCFCVLCVCVFFMYIKLGIVVFTFIGNVTRRAALLRCGVSGTYNWLPLLYKMMSQSLSHSPRRSEFRNFFLRHMPRLIPKCMRCLSKMRISEGICGSEWRSWWWLFRRVNGGRALCNSDVSLIGKQLAFVSRNEERRAQQQVVLIYICSMYV